ncbi:hypothetical protein PCASD_16157 [Puccinia coronata f. sp. avenae]|uniref:Ribosomal silencing factor RsfS n=1 Tax=Puccinia coronata f. sp. avenae TaxID=200324 RepID=A0A2N5TAJ3_9BASI|nr:hypothetical protein PCASD_16157 [Puccinia coronata f. sp. avenae]
MNAQQILSRWTSTLVRCHHPRLRPSHNIALRSGTTLPSRGFQQSQRRRNHANELEGDHVDQLGGAGGAGYEQRATVSAEPTPIMRPITGSDTAASVGASDQPWFVDEPERVEILRERPAEDMDVDRPSSGSGGPPPARPLTLPKDLHELYALLIDSPFFNPASLALIDAKHESPFADAAWTDWVVLVSLRSGRERAARGAADAVKSILEKNMDVRLEGADSSTPVTTWVMVDAGKVVVHIMTEESRRLYDLESVWQTGPSPHSRQNIQDSYS